MSSTRARKPITTRTTTRTTKASIDDVADLAGQLANNLKITEKSGIPKVKRTIVTKAKTVATKQTEDGKATAMRNVNSILQSFSSISDSGWKASNAKKTGPTSQINMSTQAKSAQSSLNVLRELKTTPLDIERAALNLVGKLIDVEMYEEALQVLRDSQVNIQTMYLSDSKIPITRTPLSKASTIPRMRIPQSSVSIDSTLQSVISTYFLNAHILFPHVAILQDSIPDELAKPGSFSSWIPHLTAVPFKTIDLILKRTYTVLISGFSSSSASPKTIFRLRVFALKLLISTADLDTSAFWEQSLKFAISFVKATDSAPLKEADKATTLLSTFSDLVIAAEEAGGGSSKLSGKGWITFCEFWMSVAKKAGDVTVIGKVAGYIQSAPAPSSYVPNGRAGQPAEENNAVSKQANDFDAIHLNVVKICATISKFLGTVVDPVAGPTENLSAEVNILTGALKQCGSTLISLPSGRSKDKLFRALESLRKKCIKGDVLQTVVDLRVEIGGTLADIYKEAILCKESWTSEDADICTSALDTLFLLATLTLSPRNADACDRAYDYLINALTVSRIYEKHVSQLAGNDKEKEIINLANFFRCISGAFFNVAGTLYKAENFGFAIRFLNDACPLAEEASRLHSELKSSSSRGKERSTEDSKTVEAWSIHHAQMYKRWELLAVCHSKSGDRKSAFTAFAQAIAHYNYEDLLDSLRTDPSHDILQSASLRSLTNMIDRATYIGANELFLKDKTSFLSLMRDGKLQDLVIGAVLERQIRSLNESRWKPSCSEVIGYLLEDLSTVYSTNLHPIRRAGTILARLEHAFYSKTYISFDEIDRMLSDLRDSLSVKDYGIDENMKHLSPIYLSSSLFWAAMLSLRRETELISVQDSVLPSVKQALQILEEWSNRLSSAKNGNPQTAFGVTNSKSTRPSLNDGKKKLVTISRLKPSARAPAVTPKPQTGSTSMRSVSHGKPPSQPSFSAKIYSSLLNLMLLTAEFLGVSGHLLERMRLLELAQRLAEFFGTSYSSESIQFVAYLAADLLRIGKVDKALALLSSKVPNRRMSISLDESLITFNLYYAEALALKGNLTKSVAVYEEAQRLSTNFIVDDKSLPSAAKIRAHARLLERAAHACRVYAVISYLKDEMTTYMNVQLQALRLFNRAIDTLTRLDPPTAPKLKIENDNPFSMTDLKEALPSTQNGENALQKAPKAPSNIRSTRDGLEWRLALLLLESILSLSLAYQMKGSAREAEYFVEHAESLTRSLHLPILISRTLVRKGELLLHLNRDDEADECIKEFLSFVREAQRIETADLDRLLGDLHQRSARLEDAKSQYTNAMSKLKVIGSLFSEFDKMNAIQRKSISTSQKPTPVESSGDFVPSLTATIMRQQVWLSRNEQEHETLLEDFLSLPQTMEVQAQTNWLLTQLSLQAIYERFHSDMFLSSLGESTVALPKGMFCESTSTQVSFHDLVEALDQATKYCVQGLTMFDKRGSIAHIRGAALSLTAIKAFQSILGKSSKYDPSAAVHLIDMASAITLRRELIDAIEYKSPFFKQPDDLLWPGSTSSHQHARPTVRGLFDDVALDDDEDEVSLSSSDIQKYWDYVREKHNGTEFIPQVHKPKEVDNLPENWIVVNIVLTDDKKSLIVSRQQAKHSPAVFCIPLKGRRDDEEEEHFTYDDAMAELKDIIHSSDESTRQSVHIKSEDREGKAAWWAQRKRLDERLKALLQNIEFCWLGAFKAVLEQPMRIPADVVSAFRSRLEKVFKNILKSKGKRQGSKYKFDDNLVELFSTLSTSCRDEELQDLVYFVLDLCHFLRIQVSLSEVDVDVITVDLRTALDEHHARNKDKIVTEPDAHTFLVLDKNVQCIPWESIPILRGKSVSRIPSIDFLTDRLAFARHQLGLPFQPEKTEEKKIKSAVVNPKKGYFILNPSKDLSGTEERFTGWVKDMQSVGWEGIIGQQPSELQFLNALSRKDLVVYFGHGGGEQYVRSHKIRHLQNCAATMLWGCSSGALRDMGDFDRVGTPNNYMIAGCPTLVANLWDVTDRDIDKFAHSVFNKLGLEKDRVSNCDAGGPTADKTSVVTAVARSRDVCKLKYLTGAAVVVYGIPFYI